MVLQGKKYYNSTLNRYQLFRYVKFCPCFIHCHSLLSFIVSSKTSSFVPRYLWQTSCEYLLYLYPLVFGTIRNSPVCVLCSHGVYWNGSLLFLRYPYFFLKKLPFLYFLHPTMTLPPELSILLFWGVLAYFPPTDFFLLSFSYLSPRVSVK